MVIRTENKLTDNAPRTTLSGPANVGDTVLGWRNANGFLASWAIQIGETGEETSEVVNLTSSSPSGTAGTVASGISFYHPTDTPIYGIKYDKVVFEKSTAGTAGTAAPISNGTIGIQADNKYTIFDDTTGTTTDAWRTFYRSSGLSVNTTESDWQTYIGYSFYSLASIRQRIREKLWRDDFLKDPALNNWINEWQEKMRNVAIAVNQDYAIGTANVAFGTAGYGTITSSDFKQLRRMDVTWNGNDWFMATKMPMNTFAPTQIFNQTHPYFYMTGENTFGIKPDTQIGTAKLAYYALGTILSNDTDELPTSMKGYTMSFVNYGYAQAKYKENKKEDGDAALTLALADLERFKSEITPRSKTGPTFMQLTEPMSADEYWI